MTTGNIRITLKDWRRLNRLIRPRKDETYAQYMNRVVNHVEETKLRKI